MSLNSAHVENGGILIHAGECIILYCKKVSLEFGNYGACVALRGGKTGDLFLTTHRMIFLNSKREDALKSFSFPFCTLNEVELEQPVFGANYLHGKVRAQPNAGFSGDATFKMTFKNGGCIEFGQAMITAARMANRYMSAGGGIPPATAAYPTEAPPEYYPAPPPAYTPAPQGYNGWMPPYSTFPSPPPVGFVYTQVAPPPYPGVTGFVQPTAPQPAAAGVQYGENPAGPTTSFYNPAQPHTAYTAATLQGAPPPYSR